MKLTKQQIIIAALTLGFVSFGTGYIVGTPHNGAKTQVEGQFNNGPGRADQRGAENPDGRRGGKGGHRGFNGPDCGRGPGNQGQPDGQQPGGQAPNDQAPNNQAPTQNDDQSQAPAQNGNQDQNNNQNRGQQAAPQAPSGQSQDQGSSQSTEKESGSGGDKRSCLSGRRTETGYAGAEDTEYLFVSDKAGG